MNSLLVAVLFRVNGKKITRIDVVATLTTPEARFPFSLAEGTLRIKNNDSKRNTSFPLVD